MIDNHTVIKEWMRNEWALLPSETDDYGQKKAGDGSSEKGGTQKYPSSALNPNHWEAVLIMGVNRIRHSIIRGSRSLERR